MPITVPTAGDPVRASWGEAITDAVNALVGQAGVALAADVATNSATAVDTGLEFAVVNGRSYTARVHGYYKVNATNQGLQLGLSTPTGTARIAMFIWGNGSATGETTANTTGSLSGRTSTDSADPALRAFWADIWFVAGASGTVKLQFARGGTSGSPGVTIRSGTTLTYTESADP